MMQFSRQAIILVPVVLGRVVGKPINVNPRLKVNRDFHLARLKWFKRLISS